MSQQEITVTISNKEIAEAGSNGDGSISFIIAKLKKAGVPEPFPDKTRGMVAAHGRLKYVRNPGSGTSIYVWQSDVMIMLRSIRDE